MVIELDGPTHVKRKDYDQIRTDIQDFKNILLLDLKMNKLQMI